MLEKIVLKKLNRVHKDAIRTASAHEKSTIGISVKTQEEPDDEGLMALAMAEDLLKMGVFSEPSFIVNEGANIHLYSLTSLGKRVANRIAEEDRDSETVYLKVRDDEHRENWIRIDNFPMKLFERESSAVDKFIMLREHVPDGSKPVIIQRNIPEGFSDEK